MKKNVCFGDAYWLASYGGFSLYPERAISTIAAVHLDLADGCFHNIISHELCRTCKTHSFCSVGTFTYS